MNVQHKLSIKRPPRVHITHDVETGGSLQKKELPFVVGVISHLAGITELEPMHERRFVMIDAENFDGVMERLSPMIKIKFRGDDLELKFERFSAFHPDNIIEAVPGLQTILQERVALTDLAGKLDGNLKLDAALSEAVSGSGDLGVAKEHMSGDATRNEELLAVLKAKIGDQKEISNLYQYIIEQIALLDHALSEGVGEVLHAPEFQELESKWRGLRHLVMNTLSSQSLKVRVMSASRADLENDLNKCPAFDLSYTFKKIYEEEYGTIGGEPYSCLIVDMYFGRSNADIDLLAKLSEIGAAAHAPIVTGTAPQMFGVDSFRKLVDINDISKLFESSESARFKSLRESEESRYLAMTMAKSLGRAPYHILDNPIEKFRFVEKAVADTDFCWINSAYCVAERIVNAYSLYGWVAAIRGVEGGGIINNLPVYNFRTQQGDVVMQCPTEVAITDRKERELSDNGFLPICHIKNTNQSVILGAQTAQRSKLYIDNDASANARIAARLPYIMNASRFAHYIKVMMRDKIGSAMSAAEVENFLQSWLANYVLLSTSPSMESKAQIPLSEGKVIVAENEDNPGSYNAILYLRPHFQMEDLTTSIRLVAKLPNLERA
jgi:type VI secretion system protein ImpC